jgi:hypothetical protein
VGKNKEKLLFRKAKNTQRRIFKKSLGQKAKRVKRSALRRLQQQRSLSRLSFTRTHIHRTPPTTHTHAHRHQDGSFCKTIQMVSLLHDAVFARRFRVAASFSAHYVLRRFIGCIGVGRKKYHRLMNLRAL